ncbi:MAG: chemotaxis-specific protein-glutamate methyltransferase CheB [Gemmataceae bacterium]|nr:chemotaxis-specific protein-glutamate methyltransferase CheB [Gemmata sp.]MDW8196070.1 chemotaxis-specific protein-glutamate methyltransferase CheB [Gemmataceae bacterium]
MRIAIVNDSALAREVLRRVVLSQPGYVVAWQAEDGEEAVARATADPPDVILMDLIMPRLDGVAATRQIMKHAPCPILVVTVSVSNNYALACQAMGAGALDAVDTPQLSPTGTILNAEKLIRRLKQLEAELAGVTGSSVIAVQKVGPAPADFPPLVLLGASTGGPEALTHILSSFPKDFPAAVLISQHIGVDFAPGLVQQLATWCRLPVRAAKSGDAPNPGWVYVAVSNDHLELGPDRLLRYTAHPRHCPYRPSIDVLFTSAAAHSARLGVAALLTGMGADGAAGLLRLRSVGWHTIAQDEATCVVYGMPKAAMERRAAVEVLPLQHIGDSIVSKILAQTRNSPRPD